MYKIKFKVTIDYKAMLMLMVKKNDSNFVLGGRGVDVEFCIFCAAKRACLKHWHGAFDEVCAECLASKANIGNWNGFRDDLLFLLEEDLSNICLCSLHQEMRNTEQLLGSLGLFAYRCGTLDDCNEAIAGYGPEVSQEYKKIKLQLKPGQQTAVTKSYISVSSFSGTTERKILDNIDDIISRALPVDKVSKYYREVASAANTAILHHITFYYEIIKYLNEDILGKGKFTRAFGTHTQEVSLDDTKVLKTFLMESEESWSKELKKLENDYLSCESKTTPRSPKKKKRRKGTNLASSSNSSHNELAYAELAATTQINLFRKVFLEWANIAETLREFDGDEDEQIDVFDVKCKVWGRCLRHLFGVSLGSGDYGHLTIDHAPMLLRLHGSFRRYSNQGFEASHKVHRALYSRATCHDKGGATESAKCVFYFRGCGWKKKSVNWSRDDVEWIEKMISLFNKIFGEDAMDYTFVKDKGMKVSSSSDPRLAFTYSHAEWESSHDLCPGSPSTNTNQSAGIIHLEDGKYSNTLETDTGPSESESQPINQAAAKPVTIDLTSDREASVQSAAHAVYFSSAVTRRELAKLKIPKVANNCLFMDVVPVSGKFVDTDPCTLLSRPPQTIVDKAERLCKKASAVKVGGLGTFSQHSIDLLRKFCDIANLKKEVQQEEGWLHGSWDGLKQDEVENIQSLLWDTTLQKTILQIGGKSIDVESFATLVGERYLDNFTIDVIIKHFIKDAGATNQALYLPSETFMWLQSDDKDFIESQIQKEVGPAFREISLILLPVHMNGMHWGLAVADLTNEKLLFDDGLKMIPGKEVIANMVKCLNIMKTMMSPGMKSFDTAFWCSQADFERFGMPSQGSGEGCGSCGVGVILSARDFIQKGSLAAGRFSWSFKESRFLRKQLMKQIISWAGE